MPAEPVVETAPDDPEGSTEDVDEVADARVVDVETAESDDEQPSIVAAATAIPINDISVRRSIDQLG